MANPDHVKILNQGPDKWRAWLDSLEISPDDSGIGIYPDLTDADLRDIPRGGHYMFAWVDLSRANISGKLMWKGYFGRATLTGADLSGSMFSETSFKKAKLQDANLERARLMESFFMQADLSHACLKDADLSGADLSGANLSGANLSGATLSEANLNGANLSHADLRGSDLSGSRLVRSILRGADVRAAVMVATTFVETDLRDGADISSCEVYGASAWRLKLDETTKQANLVITRRDEATITVDNLELAQFIYLLLHNKKIRSVIDTITSKVVLILGRFANERKAVLDAIRERLRHRNLTPVLFDFEPSSNQDITDTVTLLARMARFVIADLTDAASVPQELTLIAPEVVVAIQPIILDSQEPWAMFYDLQRRSDGLLDVLKYPDLDGLLQRLDTDVIKPLEARRKELLPEAKSGE